MEYPGVDLLSKDDYVSLFECVLTDPFSIFEKIKRSIG